MSVERGDTIRINGGEYVVTSVKNGIYGVPVAAVDESGTSGSPRYLGTVETVTSGSRRICPITLAQMKKRTFVAQSVGLSTKIKIKAATIERAAEIYVRRAKRTRIAVRLTGIKGGSGRFQGFDHARHGGQESAGPEFWVRED